MWVSSNNCKCNSLPTKELTHRKVTQLNASFKGYNRGMFSPQKWIYDYQYLFFRPWSLEMAMIWCWILNAKIVTFQKTRSTFYTLSFHVSLFDISVFLKHKFCLTTFLTRELIWRNPFFHSKKKSFFSIPLDILWRLLLFQSNVILKRFFTKTGPILTLDINFYIRWLVILLWRQVELVVLSILKLQIIAKFMLVIVYSQSTHSLFELQKNS